MVCPFAIGKAFGLAAATRFNGHSYVVHPLGSCEFVQAHQRSRWAAAVKSSAIVGSGFLVHKYAARKSSL
jgi:hypothetical protein